jgi:anaerobic magnesium-protoporphyrin IX monomethyl ester cyclase
MRGGMRVALVHPAGSNWVPGNKDMSVVVNKVVPMGLLSIAAWLERAGHEVQVIDCLGPKPPTGLEATVQKIVEFEPSLVGISATTSGFLDGYGLAAAIREARPEVKNVFGGVLPSALGSELMERFSGVDYVAVGEGEVTMTELAEGRELRNIDGLVWRDGEEVVTNRPRGRMPELDALPFPAYEKLKGFASGYSLPPFNYILTPGTGISTSRGCVYQCSFCDRSVFQRGFRSNSAEYTYAHMEHLRTKFGVRHVNIYDDLFTTNRKRVMALCDALASKPLGMQFNCAVRVGHTDDELLDALKAAGCLMVSIGMESGDPRLLEELKVGVTLDEARDTVKKIQAKGIRAKGLFMMGVVGETEESIQKTSDFIIELGLDDMNMSRFTPFHGAPCWSTIRDHGSFEEDWRLMNAINFVFVPRGIESKERLEELYNRHVKRFYTDQGWRRRFRSRLWEHRASLWYMLRNLPSFLMAKRYFEPKGVRGD